MYQTGRTVKGNLMTARVGQKKFLSIWNMTLFENTEKLAFELEPEKISNKENNVPCQHDLNNIFTFFLTGNI